MSDAVISDDNLYRYTLERRWAPSKLLVWCMLNPSTADAGTDDPTIRRCMSFAVSWGYGGIHVVNLMAFRATDPKQCLAAIDPIGPVNRLALQTAAQINHKVMCAWGTKAPPEIVKHGIEAMAAAELFCLGTTKAGHPRHPLYVKGTQPSEGWDHGGRQ